MGANHPHSHHPVTPVQPARRSMDRIYSWLAAQPITCMTALEEVPGIAGATAKKLREQDISDAEALADADPEAISVPTGNAQKLVQRANQLTITSKTAADLLDEYEDGDYYSTGVEALDEAMDGGWEAGTIGVTYGKSGKGKTQLAFSAMSEAASEGTVVYIQTEMQSKSIAQRLADLIAEVGGGRAELENIHFYEAYSITDQYDTYLTIADHFDEVDMLVIDSFTAQFRMEEDFQGRNNLGDRATEMGRHLTKVGELTRSFDCATLFTGQVYPQPEAYKKQDILWGGEKMRHYVSYFVRMSSGDGNLKKATLENHPGLEEGEVQVNITDVGLEGASQ